MRESIDDGIRSPDPTKSERNNAGETPAYFLWRMVSFGINEICGKILFGMFLIIGTKFFTWGGQKTPDLIRCSDCGTVAHFTEKTGMRFITLFFIVPTIPISGKKKMIECPNCRARFQAE